MYIYIYILNHKSVHLKSVCVCVLCNLISLNNSSYYIFVVLLSCIIIIIIIYLLLRESSLSGGQTHHGRVFSFDKSGLTNILPSFSLPSFSLLFFFFPPFATVLTVIITLRPERVCGSGAWARCWYQPRPCFPCNLQLHPTCSSPSLAFFTCSTVGLASWASGWW